MRALLVTGVMTVCVVLFALAGCGRDALPAGGDMSGGGAGGSSGSGGVGGSGDGGAGGSGARVCVANCGRCTTGACCGDACCAAGEWCDTTTNTCRCGGVPACSAGKMCAHGGPIGPGTTACGSVCCGGPTPCPL